jgi:hypothetical protein
VIIGVFERFKRLEYIRLWLISYLVLFSHRKGDLFTLVTLSRMASVEVRAFEVIPKRRFLTWIFFPFRFAVSSWYRQKGQLFTSCTFIFFSLCLFARKSNRRNHGLLVTRPDHVTLHEKQGCNAQSSMPYQRQRSRSLEISLYALLVVQHFQSIIRNRSPFSRYLLGVFVATQVLLKFRLFSISSCQPHVAADARF